MVERKTSTNKLRKRKHKIQKDLKQHQIGEIVKIRNELVKSKIAVEYDAKGTIYAKIGTNT